jgi:hypothetical protein
MIIWKKYQVFTTFLFIDLLPFEFTNLSLLRMRKACSHGPPLIFQAYTLWLPPSRLCDPKVRGGPWDQTFPYT